MIDKIERMTEIHKILLDMLNDISNQKASSNLASRLDYMCRIVDFVFECEDKYMKDGVSGHIYNDMHDLGMHIIPRYMINFIYQIAVLKVNELGHSISILKQAH